MRRASRGCDDARSDESAVWEEVRELRSVSWSPGADGAPVSSCCADLDGSDVLEAEVGWDDRGTIRIACEIVSRRGTYIRR